ncbi:MAG: sodium:calcium antiporter, partial [Bacteroidetes bacterium]|nr:sodium:calcium antiporter [Bacteroidota bacterium]
PLTYNPVLNTDLNFMVFGTVLLFTFMFTFKRNRLDRVESGIYLTGFFAYMVFVFIREQMAI